VGRTTAERALVTLDGAALAPWIGRRDEVLGRRYVPRRRLAGGGEGRRHLADSRAGLRGSRSNIARVVSR
jgi:hypothetical protein